MVLAQSPHHDLASTTRISQLETKLLQIWGELLRCDSLETHDNFFALGGNSLLALTLICRIESELEIKLPVTSIMEAPTVAEFALIVEGKGSHRPITSLRDGSGPIAVFLVHDADGETILYRNLARRLSTNNAVYGLKPLSQPGIPILHTKLEEMAEFHIKNMREIQPHGPYVIGGLCAGGLIAYEMASQLEQAGESVAVLALMDAADVAAKERPLLANKARFTRLTSSLSQDRRDTKLRRILLLSKTITRKAFNLTKYLISSRFKSIRDKAKLKLFQLHLKGGQKIPTYLQGISVRTAYNHAKTSYRPFKPLQAELLLIRATSDSGAVGDDPYTGRYLDPLLGWGSRTLNGVQLLDSPGGHFTMLQEPHVERMAEQLSNYILSRLKESGTGAAKESGITSVIANNLVIPAFDTDAAHESQIWETPSADQSLHTLLKNVYMVRISAGSQEELTIMSGKLASFVETLADEQNFHLECTSEASSQPANWRRLVSGASRAEFLERLKKGSGKGVWSNSGKLVNRPIAFIIAGVGEQAAGSGHELYTTVPVFRDSVDECAKILEPVLGRDIRPEMLSPQKSSGNWMRGASGQDILRETRVAQPAAFILNWSLARMWMSWGVKPEAVLGYSVGEYVAAALSGVLRMEDALIMLARRAEWIDTMARPGAMLAVSLSETELLPRLRGEAWLAAVNSPQAVVVGGTEESIQQLEKELQDSSIAARRVVSMNGTHTPLLDSVKPNLKQLVQMLHMGTPQIPMVSNVTGTWLTERDIRNTSYWGDHMCGTLRFEAGIGELLGEPERLILEIGPGAGLGAMVRQHTLCRRELMGRILTSLPASWDKVTEREHVLSTLGRMWVEGVEAEWKPFNVRNISRNQLT